MQIRMLRPEHLNLGLLEVLANLSHATPIALRRRRKIFGIYQLGPTYHTLVAIENGRVVGAATLIVNYKLLRGGVAAGRLSDVAVHPKYEGQGIGTILVERLIAKAKRFGCYMIKLNCSKKNVPWYQRFGFKVHGVCMRLDLNPNAGVERQKVG